MLAITIIITIAITIITPLKRHEFEFYSLDCCPSVYSSGSQPFWPWELILWKTVFLQIGMGNGFGMIHAHCIYCVFCFLLSLHQLHFRSSGRSWRLGTPSIAYMYVSSKEVRGRNQRQRESSHLDICLFACLYSMEKEIN